MALIDEVKTALRVTISDDAIDLQIQSLIDAAKEDLKFTSDISSDLVEQEETPALIKQAIVLFVKMNWTDNIDEAEKLRRSFDLMKGSLAMSSFYSSED